MEKKTTQRIVGILVVIALVIILMPLLLDKNEAATQTASAKAPPFPDQPQNAPPLTVASADDKNAPSSIYISPEIADKINKVASQATKPIEQEVPGVTMTERPATPKPIVETAAQPAAPTPAVTAPATATPTMPPKFQMISEPVKPGAEPKAAPIAPVATPAIVAKPIMNTSAIKTANVHAIKSVKPKHVITTASATHTIKHKITTASATHAKHKVQPVPLANLKKVAWAVQLGSFKNRDNARHLADKLRVAGYKAFTHDVKSPKGNTQVRVYIGPEYKQASAAKLSMQLEEKLKMHGFIVPYKPLEI